MSKEEGGLDEAEYERRDELVRAFMDWVSAAIDNAEPRADCSDSLRESRARGLVRNLLGLHQHEDGSGQFFGEEYKEKHRDQRT